MTNDDVAGVIEDNANLVLWAVHVLGADDLYPMPSHAAAVSAAQKGNDLCARHTTVNDILWFAYAAPWPGTADEHAALSARLATPGAPE